jgi:hypothetical protein
MPKTRVCTAPRPERRPFRRFFSNLGQPLEYAGDRAVGRPHQQRYDHHAENGDHQRDRGAFVARVDWRLALQETVIPHMPWSRASSPSWSRSLARRSLRTCLLAGGAGSRRRARHRLQSGARSWRDVRSGHANRRGGGLGRWCRRLAVGQSAGREHSCPARGACATRDTETKQCDSRDTPKHIVVARSR